MGAKNVVKGAGKIGKLGTEKLGAAGVIIGVAEGAMVVVDKAVEIIDKRLDAKAEALKNTVAIPDLCAKGFPHTVEQAVEVMNAIGARHTTVLLPTDELSPKYRNYIHMQVVNTKPKAGERMPKEDGVVIIKYITQDLIDECRRMYEDELARRIKRKEKRDEIIKSVMAKASGTVKRNFKKLKTPKIRKSKKIKKLKE